MKSDASKNQRTTRGNAKINRTRVMTYTQKPNGQYKPTFRWEEK